LHNIVLPAAQLFGASFTYAADWLQAERIASIKDWKNWPPDWRTQSLKNRHHLIGDVIAAARAGAAIPRVQASEHARRKVREYYGSFKLPVVTMTHRRTYLKARNSDLSAWEKARWKIAEAGYGIVTLQDTDTALSDGKGYGELNLDLRTACYQEAALNLVSSNGPASLCWFGEKPYRMFGAGVPADEWQHLFVEQGLPLGQHWPWASEDQKLVYGETTVDQMIQEFDAWVSATK
jgi:hypothetical protein